MIKVSTKTSLRMSEVRSQDIGIKKARVPDEEVLSLHSKCDFCSFLSVIFLDKNQVISIIIKISDINQADLNWPTLSPPPLGLSKSIQ